MLTAKIEAMVIEAIERAVKKEIEKINTLIEELEDNQKQGVLIYEFGFA